MKGKQNRIELVTRPGENCSHVSHVRNVSDHEVATGILGYFGNKGGVAVRLDFHNTSLCFVCSHLAAHQTEVDRRNQDYQQIMTGLQQEFISRGLKINDSTDRNRTLGCDQVSRTFSL